MTNKATSALTLRAATSADAPLLHRLMLAAYEEYRDTLVPASGAFEESIDDVRQAIVEGGGVVGEPRPSPGLRISGAARLDDSLRAARSCWQSR